MSRSLGDLVAHSVGVSELPEVLEFNLGPNDKFAVVASDGLWEFLPTLNYLDDLWEN